MLLYRSRLIFHTTVKWSRLFRMNVFRILSTSGYAAVRVGRWCDQLQTSASHLIRLSSQKTRKLPRRYARGCFCVAGFCFSQLSRAVKVSLCVFRGGEVRPTNGEKCRVDGLLGVLTLPDFAFPSYQGRYEQLRCVCFPVLLTRKIPRLCAGVRSLRCRNSLYPLSRAVREFPMHVLMVWIRLQDGWCGSDGVDLEDYVAMNTTGVSAGVRLVRCRNLLLPAFKGGTKVPLGVSSRFVFGCKMVPCPVSLPVRPMWIWAGTLEN